MTTLTRPPRRIRHRDLQAEAVRAGIDPVVAATTPTDDLRAVIAAAPQLRLVNDVDAPRLGRKLTPRQRMENSGMSPDEIASVLLFATGRLHETTGTADGFTPLDYYHGPQDAA